MQSIFQKVPSLTLIGEFSFPVAVHRPGPMFSRRWGANQGQRICCRREGLLTKDSICTHDSSKRLESSKTMTQRMLKSSISSKAFRCMQI